MDPDSNILAYLLLLAALILINAFFAMSEIAVITLNDAKIRRMAEEGDKKAKIIAKLTSAPSRFLATIQVGVTLSGFLASAVAAESFTGIIVTRLGHLPFPPAVLHGVTLFAITLLLSYITLIFGELVPKRIAMHFHERVAFAVAPVLLLLYGLMKPFVLILSASANLIVRLFGIDPNAEPENVTEEEIRMMVDVGNEKGVIEQSEKEMIDNIFEFDDRTADEIMTHRTDVIALEKNSTVLEASQVATKFGYSRIPVYNGEIDDVVGILYVKDLLTLVGSEDASDHVVEEYMRPAIFVPESNSCTELFKVFNEKHVQMAIVVDEYGGTAGVVTMEDLLEAIVGNMQDEFDNEDEEISRVSDTVFTLDGAVMLDDVEKLLGVKIPEDVDCDTLGGFITDLLDRIPGEQEHPVVIVDGVKFTVEQVEDRRIARVRAEILEPHPEPNGTKS